MGTNASDRPEAIVAPNAADGDWQLDVEPDAELREADVEAAPVSPSAAPMQFPKTVAEPDAPPPSPLQIVEAMLFIGGPPLTAEKACAAIRGLTHEKFRELVDELARSYRRQNRPYAVQPRETGWVLALRSQYRGVLAKLGGGGKETRLTQPAIDALGLVAYRQPIGKAEIDTARGADSAGVLRQLVRLGLVTSARGAIGYETTPRFLQLFGLRTLDDLPQLGDSV